MAVVLHFLTIPLYDVMTLVASGSHAFGVRRANVNHLREAGLRPLLQTRESGGRERCLSRPLRQAYGVRRGDESVARPIAPGRRYNLCRPCPGGGIGRHAALRGL